jgi:hypothetical protein
MTRVTFLYRFYKGLTVLGVAFGGFLGVLTAFMLILVLEGCGGGDSGGGGGNPAGGGTTRENLFRLDVDVDKYEGGTVEFDHDRDGVVFQEKGTAYMVYPKGMMATLTAKPWGSAYKFSEWKVTGSSTMRNNHDLGESKITIDLQKDTRVIAYFRSAY